MTFSVFSFTLNIYTRLINIYLGLFFLLGLFLLWISIKLWSVSTKKNWILKWIKKNYRKFVNKTVFFFTVKRYCCISYVQQILNCSWNVSLSDLITKHSIFIIIYSSRYKIYLKMEKTINSSRKKLWSYKW